MQQNYEPVVWTKMTSQIYTFFLVKGSGKVSANYLEKSVRTGRRCYEQNAYNITPIRFTIPTSGISHIEVTTCAEMDSSITTNTLPSTHLIPSCNHCLFVQSAKSKMHYIFYIQVNPAQWSFHDCFFVSSLFHSCYGFPHPSSLLPFLFFCLSQIFCKFHNNFIMEGEECLTFCLTK